VRGAGTGRTLLRRGLRLEYLTLGWNVLGTVVVILAALAARSVALAGFGLDSLIDGVPGDSRPRGYSRRGESSRSWSCSSASRVGGFKSRPARATERRHRHDGAFGVLSVKRHGRRQPSRVPALVPEGEVGSRDCRPDGGLARVSKRAKGLLSVHAPVRDSPGPRTLSDLGCCAAALSSRSPRSRISRELSPMS